MLLYTTIDLVRAQYVRERLSVALQRGNAEMVGEWQHWALGPGQLDVHNPGAGEQGAAGMVAPPRRLLLLLLRWWW